jgi:glycosyltransferase involved in cell wall biosynthesis
MGVGMTVMVSYLVPSYNHEKYIFFLLESIKLDIEQLAVVAEIIIIDDGSLDNSRAIIQSWAETYKEKFKIIYQFQENKGIASVLNRLIDLASGQYLRLCASDDVIVTGSTKLLLQQFKYKQDLRCVFADGRVIDEFGNLIHQSSIAFHRGSAKRLKEPKSLAKELIQRWCIAGPAILVKRSHYDNMRYDESSRIEDYQLILSLLELPNSVSFINEIVCFYRIHSTNTSKTKKVEQRVENIKSFLRIIDSYLNRQPLKSYLLPVKYKSLAKIYFLQKKFIRCFFNFFISVLFKIKGDLAARRV